MKTPRAVLALVVSALALSSCTLVSTSSSPTLINDNDVPLGLLGPTIPFTDFARVTFVSREIYLVNRAQLVVPESRLVTSPPSLFAVLYHLTQGPTTQEQSLGVTTQLPASLVVIQAGITNGVGSIEVNTALTLIPPVGRRIAVAQLLFTAMAMGATQGIRITINQLPFSLTLANGAKVSLITPGELSYLKAKST
jgi:hypothetical protein